jgi:hypothetical protein
MSYLLSGAASKRYAESEDYADSDGNDQRWDQPQPSATAPLVVFEKR